METLSIELSNVGEECRDLGHEFRRCHKGEFRSLPIAGRGLEADLGRLANLLPGNCMNGLLAALSQIILNPLSKRLKRSLQ